MKTNLTLSVIIAIVFVVAACKKTALVSADNPGSNAGTGGTSGTSGSGSTGVVKVKTAPDTGVYLVGYKSERNFPLEPKPMLWKNNNPSLLGYFEGVANAVCALDTNIIAAGTETFSKGTNAVYWYKNYILRLTYNDFYGGRSNAVAIAVSGKDVYIAGNNGRPVYWKNGEQVLLSSGSSRDGVTGMVLKGNDIYVSGYCYTGTPFYRTVACYWKNGVLHSTDDNVFESTATGIAVDDNGNVFLSGSIRGTATPKASSAFTKPVYWKNNTLIALPTDMINASANGIAINGSNIYITGTADDNKGNAKGGIWTNGTFANLPNSTSAKAICIIKDEIYVTGTRPIDALTTYGVVWKGNNIIAQGSLTSFNGICVVK